MQMPTPGVDYGHAVAAEVRAMMARREVAGKSLAARLGVSPMYVSRRMRGDVPWNVAELAEVARLLDCRMEDLLPRLDSNQKPAGCGHAGYGTSGYRRGEVALAA